MTKGRLEAHLVDNTTDVPFHFAVNAYVPPSVESPSFDYQTNLAATFASWKRCDDRNGRDGFSPSSAAVYGNAVRVPIREEDPTSPDLPCGGVGKLAVERVPRRVRSAIRAKPGLGAVLLGLRTRQRKQVVFDLLAKLSKDHDQLFIHGDGTHVRDFLDVKDAAM
jgi:UDP-glucose 4-epimerase